MKVKVQLNLMLVFFLAGLLVVGLSGCKKDEKESFEPGIVLSSSKLSVQNVASEQSVEVTANESWQAESNADWISIPVASGEAGVINVAFSVAKNEGDARTGIITVTTKRGAKAELEVTQDAGSLSEDIYVKVNGELVFKEDYDHKIVMKDDNVQIIHLLAGG